MKYFYFSILISFCSSIQLLSAQSTNPAPYCSSNYSNIPAPTLDFISDVTITGGILSPFQNLGTGQWSYPNYVLYTGFQDTIILGQTVSLNVSTVTTSPAALTAWLDINQDLIFSSNEVICSSWLPSAGINYSIGNFVIPFNAITGLTRLRIQLVNDTAYINNTVPCGTFSNGETEDYNIVVGAMMPLSNSIISEIHHIEMMANIGFSNLLISVNNISPNKLKIIDISGKEHLIIGDRVGANIYRLDISRLSAGLYFIKYENEVIRFIKD